MSRRTGAEWFPATTFRQTTLKGKYTVYLFTHTDQEKPEQNKTHTHTHTPCYFITILHTPDKPCFTFP